MIVDRLYKYLVLAMFLPGLLSAFMFRPGKRSIHMPSEIWRGAVVGNGPIKTMKPSKYVREKLEDYHRRKPLLDKWLHNVERRWWIQNLHKFKKQQ